jgi:hypothetical protein
LINCHD